MHHLARKYQKFPGGACPQTPLAVGAFGTSLCHIRLPLLKILATALVSNCISLNISPDFEMPHYLSHEVTLK